MSSFPEGKNPFAEEVNPYAPSAVPTKAAPLPRGSVGAWRQGNQLVAYRHWSLPPFCLRTNGPAETSVRRTVYWLHPAVYIALISPLIFVILALVLRKRMILDLPLSQAFREQHKRKLLVSSLFTAGGLLVTALGVVLAVNLDADAGPAIFVFILVGFLAILIGSIWLNRVYNIITASKIDGDYAWIKGVDSGYLERLPVWPYA